jgi:hypothetical protein
MKKIDWNHTENRHVSGSSARIDVDLTLDLEISWSAVIYKPPNLVCTLRNRIETE